MQLRHIKSKYNTMKKFSLKKIKYFQSKNFSLFTFSTQGGSASGGHFSLSRGFTLIELLVVIVIIGILASLLMVNFIGIRARARDAQRKSDLRQIQSALELYRSDSGSYPATASFPVCGNPLRYTVSGNTTTYMQKIPCDPTNTASLIYRYYSPAGNNLIYTLIACLENINDQQRDLPSNKPPLVDGSASIATCDGATNWSYTLFSP